MKHFILMLVLIVISVPTYSSNITVIVEGVFSLAKTAWTGTLRVSCDSDPSLCYFNKLLHILNIDSRSRHAFSYRARQAGL